MVEVEDTPGIDVLNGEESRERERQWVFTRKATRSEAEADAAWLTRAVQKQAKQAELKISDLDGR